MCYGLCLNIIENHNWDENNIKKYISKNSQFELIKSDGGETNICSKYNRNYFIKKVLRDFPDGIHLFTADGEYTGTSHDNNVYLFKLQDLSVFKQLCSEIIIGCNILSPSGIIIVKILACRNLQFISLLHLLTSMFDRISIVKPNSSRPASMESFLLLRDYHKNEELLNKIDEFIDTLPSFLTTNEKYPIESLEDVNEILKDTEFVDYIRNINNESIKREADMCELINKQNEMKTPIPKLSEIQKQTILSNWGLKKK